MTAGAHGRRDWWYPRSENPGPGAPGFVVIGEVRTDFEAGLFGEFMSVWVKICGNTTLEDAELAVAAGADAVGFVFADGPRRVTVEAVEGIAPRLAGRVERIGVFVEAEAARIIDTVERCGLTGVQLHGGATSAETAKLVRARFGAGLRLLRVVHFGAEAGAEVSALGEAISEAMRADLKPGAGLLAGLGGGLDAVLVDTKTATAVGGTGVPFDWAEARRTIFGGESGVRLIAAGGLRPENVAEAIRVLRPWGVDVASGVEAAPGRKDAARVSAFVERARAAAREFC